MAVPPLPEMGKYHTASASYKLVIGESVKYPSCRHPARHGINDSINGWWGWRGVVPKPKPRERVMAEQLVHCTGFKTVKWKCLGCGQSLRWPVGWLGQDKDGSCDRCGGTGYERDGTGRIMGPKASLWNALCTDYEVDKKTGETTLFGIAVWGYEEPFEVARFAESDDIVMAVWDEYLEARKND